MLSHASDGSDALKPFVFTHAKCRDIGQTLHCVLYTILNIKHLQANLARRPDPDQNLLAGQGRSHSQPDPTNRYCCHPAMCATVMVGLGCECDLPCPANRTATHISLSVWVGSQAKHTATHVPYIMYVVCMLLCGWIAGLGRPPSLRRVVCAT